jgi:hypothetical protein
LQEFYKEARFYSIVATSSDFQVRIHRARELSHGRIKDDYPLEFVYEVMKSGVTDMIKNQAAS